MKRLIILVVAALAGLLVLAPSAAAHVTVSAPGAARGGTDQLITFRVPVEKNVATTGLTIVVPTATPIASLEVAPLPGWTHAERTAKLSPPLKTDDGMITSAVSQVTWTAKRGQGVQPGEFGAFTILAGQLPDANSIAFKAVQTYADGSVVRWIETAAPGSSTQPEHPAPVLRLALTGGGPLVQPIVPKAAKAPSNTGPVALSIIALVLAAAALGVAVVSRARKASG